MSAEPLEPPPPPRRRGGYRYGRWSGGADPLAPPFDVREALDGIGDDILSGSTPADALRRLLQRGRDGLNGLDDLRRRLRKRREQLRRSGRLDGTLDQVRELLDQALESEKRALFADPDDMARFEEAELDALPDETASAVRALADRQWRSPEAAQKYQEIQDLLRREVLDSQFAGMKNALQNASPEDMARVRDMMADLNDLLSKHARGEAGQQDLDQFLDKHGEFFPERPNSIDELIDQLARRAAASQRMMDGLTADQRAELGDLMDQMLGGDIGLSAEMERLNQQLRAARPDLRWGGDPRMQGQEGMGMGDATSAVAELSDVESLDRQLGQQYAGAGLDDVDEELVQRALGREAVDDLNNLRRIERELSRQGWLQNRNGQLELAPKALRRLGATALKRVFAQLHDGPRGDHDIADAGAAGELTGSSRIWQFGDTQPLDVVRTVRNAVLRTGPTSDGVRLTVDDFEVVETERRSRAAVALLVDLSYSMELNGTWGAAKSTALALHHLVTTRYPQDSIELIGFSQYARPLRPAELAGLDFDPVQGTNLQHALMLARRHLTRHSDAEPILLVVTDGEPTAHLERDGEAVFMWPPMPETLALTLAEVDRATRAGVAINVFMLGEDPRLVDFMTEVARRNGGRIFTSDADNLGEYVVRDFLARRTAIASGRRR
ncbi:vWA domain-containing protein [Cryptosporangium arvum]|uniref:vWA domain-containing protein n=1 Tax=Cryptosporangium arvum TaxID=80871 RepID=UPI0004B385E3|nr:VWA domain-containing protein [Cryptosporangium arvum]